METSEPFAAAELSLPVQCEVSANRSATTVRYQTLAWLATASGLAYLCRNALSVAESRIREDLNLTLSQSGYFLGAFFWTYAFFQVPAGAFSHHFGTRLAMTVFAVTWSLALFVTAISPALWMLITAQLVMGIAQAGFFPAATSSLKHWMPMSRRSLSGSLLAVGMQTGAIISSILTGLLLSVIGWRWIFALFSVPGILWALAFYARFRDRPEHSPYVNDAERALILSGRPKEQAASTDDGTGPTDWSAMLRHRGLWLIYGQQFCRSAGYMFYASWFPTFLQQTHGISIAQSGYIQGIIFTAVLAGSLSGGFLTDWIWKKTGNLRMSRSAVGAVALGGCGLLILCSWTVESAWLGIGLMATGSLLGSMAGPVMIATVIDIGGSRVAHVLGAVNMTGNFAAAACPIIVGKLFEKTSNWNFVLVLFACIYLIGGICWVFVNPRIGIFRPIPPKTEI